MIQSLKDKLTNILTSIHKPVVSGIAAGLDFNSLLTEFVAAIIETVRGCINPGTAAARIKEGGAVAYSSALRIVKKTTDLRGVSRRQKAMELVEAGKGLNDEEMQDILNQAADIPVTTPPTGLWPIALLFCLLFSSTASAQVWPVDVEQNMRLDRLEAAVFPEKATASPPKTLPLDHAPAYQIINGVVTHTSDAHLLEHGYTAAQIAGLTQKQKDALHGAAHAVQGFQQQAHQAQPQYRMECNGRRCRRVRIR